MRAMIKRYANAIITVSAFVIMTFLLIIASIGMRACDTASKMADKTVFNAQQHVVSYEQFRDDYQAYLRYVNSYCEYKKKLQNNKALSTEDKLTMDGYYKMALDIAQRYNANAMKFYKKVWKGDLPERLPLEVNCNGQR